MKKKKSEVEIDPELAEKDDIEGYCTSSRKKETTPHLFDL